MTDDPGDNASVVAGTNLEETSATIEGQKLFHDSLKHFATLSTGSILIMATLLDRIIEQPVWRGLVVVAFVAFVVCAVSAAFAMSTVSSQLVGRRFIDQIPDRLSWKRTYVRNFEHFHTLRFVTVGLTVLSFVVGIVSLSVFAIINLG